MDAAYARQPPSGGCELKQENIKATVKLEGQPPSGGCELKLNTTWINGIEQCQPPSGGCELKHEECTYPIEPNLNQPPSGGCELKPIEAGGRHIGADASRLRAAVS